MTIKETSSSSENLSVVMTTTPDDDVNQTTDAAASSTSGGVEFYFQCSVVVIGFAGMITNGLILYALIASKQHKKQFLIFNQNAIDFFSSLWLFITHVVKLGNVRLSGLFGYLLCVLEVGEGLIWIGLTGSKINLGLITIERYLKIVHHKWSKKWIGRMRVRYSAAAFSWIVSIIHAMGFMIPTTVVIDIDGNCWVVTWLNHTSEVAFQVYSFLTYCEIPLLAHVNLREVIRENHTSKVAFQVYTLLTYYAVPLVVIAYCYGHILVVVRRQARVMAAHTGLSGPGASQNQTNQKLKSSVITTMLLVSAFFALFNLPFEIVFLMMTVNDEVSLNEYSYYSATFVMFLFVCTSPFIYATKFDPVKRVLLDSVPGPCKKMSAQVVESVRLHRVGPTRRGNNQN